MAQQTKVSVNIQQDFNEDQQRQARSNIGASKVQYVDTTVEPITVERGDLNVVKYLSGTHFNDGDGNIGVMVPEPASGMNDYVLMNTEQGVRWEMNNPPEDVFIEDYYNLNYNKSTNSQELNRIIFPKHGDSYPTKIEGHFMCWPMSGYEYLSIVPISSVTGNVIQYDSHQNVNTYKLFALSQDEATIGDYPNTVPFMAHKKDTIPDKEIVGVSIKGQSGSTPRDYNIMNIYIRCFYEKPKGGA
jgi:hypothetical protein